MRLLLISLLALILVMGLASADLMKIPQNEDFMLTVSSNNATQCNLTSIQTPLGYKNYNLPLQKNVQSYNMSISSSNFTQVGNAYFSVLCTDGYNNADRVIGREITPSGFGLDSGGAIIVFGSLFVIILISGAFFLVAKTNENQVAKIGFYSASIIVAIMAILYAIIAVQQTLFGFSGLITGIETFWFVMKSFGTVAILGLGIIVFLIMLKAWRIKRGLRDVDD